MNVGFISLGCSKNLVDNFREMIDYTANTYKDRIAFSYKKDKTSKNPEYINISYKKHKEDIEAFSTKLLELGLEGKRIAIISHNKYQWPLSYMAINNGNMVVVPLDYMLPENEIESLIKRSEAEAVIFENKYVAVHSNVWCNGKNESTLSLSFIFINVVIALTFEHMFFCESSTALETPVVPDVNSIIDILSLSIFIFLYIVFPSFNNSYPSFSSS